MTMNPGGRFSLPWNPSDRELLNKGVIARNPPEAGDAAIP